MDVVLGALSFVVMAGMWIVGPQIFLKKKK